mgnify:CR=1 FL=1
MRFDFGGAAPLDMLPLDDRRVKLEHLLASLWELYANRMFWECGGAILSGGWQREDLLQPFHGDSRRLECR